MTTLLRRWRGTDHGPAPSFRLPLIFALVVIGCALLEPVLLSGANIKSALTTYVVEVALVTAGQSLAMTTGGIDLSVAGTVDLVGIAVGEMAQSGHPTIVLVSAGLGIGVGCGLFNGLVITLLRVPPIMVTLATGILFRGIAEGLANGKSFSAYPHDFVRLGQGYVSGLPTQVWVAAIVLVLTSVVMGATRYGRWVYAVGANLRAAKLSGVPVDAVRVGVYLSSGALCAIAALIMSARLNSAGPNMGVGLELASVTAAVLGGVSVFGGRGTVFGAVLGVLTIGALESGLTLHEVASEVQDLCVAALLLVTLLIERTSLTALMRSWRYSPDDPVGPESASAAHPSEETEARTT